MPTRPGYLALITLLATACAGNDGKPADAIPTPSTPCSPPNCTELEIGAFDFYFRPEQPAAPAGTIRVVLTNQGRQVHNLSIRDGDRPATPNLLPGLKGFVDLKLAPKTYELFCSVPGHLEQGMKTTLTVK